MQRLLGIFVAALVIGGGFAWWQNNSNTPGSAAIELPGAAIAQSTEGGVDTSTIVEMALGAEDAPVTIVEYASYTCPHCRAFHEGVFKDLKADYIDTGHVRFVYREVYFDRFGLWASMVARCGGPERFFGISDLIYAQQSDWTHGGDPATIAGNLRRIGATAGVSQEELDGCLSDAGKAEALVAWYQQNAARDEVNSTPSFVIDGVKYGNLSLSEFRSIIDPKL